MYPSDLDDEEWALVKPLLAKTSKRGRPQTQDYRVIVNAILYVVKTGCQWRQLPHDYPKWSTVVVYFYRWQRRGVWTRLLDKLRRKARKDQGKNEAPSAMIVDSQSVRTVSHGAQRGYDAGKKVKGRKRHIAVDTLGLPWAIAVHSAGIQDRTGVKLLLLRLFTRLACTLTVFADAAYTGKLAPWMKDMFGWTLEVVHKGKDKAFHVLPKRWIVERSFGWLGHYRRLSKDYEIRPAHAEAMITLAFSRMLLRRAVA